MRANERLNTALLFAGDKTPALNKIYYPITITCDGGSAVILRKHHDRRVILATEVLTLGELHDVWYVPGPSTCGPDEPFTEELLHMKSDMKRFNESVITINLFMFRKVMRAAMKRVGLKSPDIARRAKASRKSVRHWVARGDLAAYKLGGCWRISEDDYAKFLAERRVTNRT